MWSNTVKDLPDAEAAGELSFQESWNDSCCERGDDDDLDHLLQGLRRLSRQWNRLK